MKVKELIEKLQKCDKNAKVIKNSDNFELNYTNVPISFVKQYDKGKKEEKTFIDSFDGTNYNKEVYSIEGGNEKLVFIC